MSSTTKGPVPAPPRRVARTVARMPPISFFLTSAVFHYLGPSLAVLLFVHIGVLGVAWLRISGIRAVAPALADPRPSQPISTAGVRRPWCRAGRHELAVLPGCRPASAVHGRGRSSFSAPSSSLPSVPGPAATCSPSPWPSAGCSCRPTCGTPASRSDSCLPSPTASASCSTSSGHRIANTAPAAKPHGPT